MKYTKKAYGYSSWYNKVKYIDAFETFIKHFLKKKRFTLEDLNVSIFDEYIKYKYEVRKNKAPEAVNKSLVPLYEAVKNATVCGIIPPLKCLPLYVITLYRHEKWSMIQTQNTTIKSDT